MAKPIPSSRPNSHTVRAAEPSDAAALADLDAAVFAPSQRWSRQLWNEELEADNRFVDVVIDGSGKVRGVISIQVVGPTAELIRVAVDPAVQRRGLGALLVGTGLERAVLVEAEEMLLEVRHDNHTAIDLYTRWGFSEIARRDGYYGQDRDGQGIDAVIMQRELEDPDDQ